MEWVIRNRFVRQQYGIVYEICFKFIYILCCLWALTERFVFAFLVAFLLLNCMPYLKCARKLFLIKGCPYRISLSKCNDTAIMRIPTKQIIICLWLARSYATLSINLSQVYHLNKLIDYISVIFYSIYIFHPSIFQIYD